MADNYYNQSPPGNNYFPQPHHQGRRNSTANYAPYSSTEQGYYPPPPQNNYGSYRPPEDDAYRGSPRTSNTQVAPAYESSYYNDEPRSRRRHSLHHPRDYNDNAGRSGGGEKSFGYKKDGGHQSEKKVAATVAGGALGAFAVHELGGHNDVATVVGGLVGAFAGNKLEKTYEANKEEKLRRESESRGSSYGGSGPVFGSSRDLVRDEDGERRGSWASRRRTVDDDSSSDSDSDGIRRRRRHRH